MACVSGTNIVNDGLVFHFDLENGVKSWKGKPTTNLIAGSVLTSWSGTGSRVADTTVLSETYDGGTIYHLEDATGVDPNVEVDNFYMYNSYSPVVAGEQYTFSMDVKVLQKSNSAKVGASNCFWIWYAQSTEYVYFSDLPLNEWTRVHVTCTVGSTYNYIIPRIDYDNTILEIANLQLEAGNIATKFVNGIRLGTASIIDVSPSKGTITAANLTYRQDDTPTFDGTDDYVVTDRIPGTGTSTSSVSWCIWTKPAGSSGNIMSMSSANPQTSWNMPPIAASGGKFRGKIWPNSYLFSETYTQGNWYYVCLVYNYSATIGQRYQRLYVNGEQAAEQTGITYSASNSNNFLFFGQANPGADNTGYYAGEIGKVEVYNRALTETEIKQNFEATRSRYGI